jgi:hypothetical protein
VQTKLTRSRPPPLQNNSSRSKLNPDAFHTTKPNGIGMGLAISRSIILARGGQLRASNNTPKGAVFPFTLPAIGRGHTASLRSEWRIGRVRPMPKPSRQNFGRIG